MTDTAPQIFVINLPRDTDRRAQMQERLGALELDHEFIDGVDGRDIPDEYAGLYDSAKRLRYFGRDLKLGEIGCTFSHYKIFQKMVDENIPHAVVLEDDVIFEDDFPAVLAAIMTSKRRWDVIRFIGNKKIYKRGCRVIEPLVGRYSFGRLPTTPGGAYGYVTTLAAAKRMVAYMSSTWMPIDGLQGRMWATGLETLVIHPAPLYADDVVESTIGDARFDKTLEISGLARVFYPLRRGFLRANDAVGKKYVYWSSWFRDRRV